jgi:hypothetical protein
VSAAAAVAEAASEVLANAPPAMAATLSILDPVRPANCATDLENTASDAAVDTFRPGAAQEELLYVFNVRPRLWKWCVGEAKSDHQTADEADACQHSAERCRIIEL